MKWKTDNNLIFKLNLFLFSATKDSTLKKIASKKTFSCVIEDHTSSTKEKNLVKAAFDKATMHLQVIIYMFNVFEKIACQILGRGCRNWSPFHFHNQGGCGAV